MKQALRCLQTGAIFLFLSLVAQAQGELLHAFRWTQAAGMQDMGKIPGWQNSLASAINRQGQVVGYDTLNSNATSFWCCGVQGMQPLKGLSSAYSGAVGINDSGEVVGNFWSGPIATAFLWTYSGGTRILGTLGGSSCMATGINNLGQVVGSSTTADGIQHAFVWTQAQGLQDLGQTFGSKTASQALGINDLGMIVGYVNDKMGNATAVLWNDGQAQRIGPGVATAINIVGQVVGETSTPTTPQRAFIWTKQHGMLDLGLLPDGVASFAQGINKYGQVVGWNLTTPGTFKAFLWTVGGGLKDLGNLGGIYGAQAFAINDSGEVVGSSTIQ